MDKIQKRQVAYKVRIADILKGEYIKEDGDWVPNYIMLGNKKVSRVNLVAVVVSKQELENTNYQNLLIDDGSGKVSVRSFDEMTNFKGINVGDFVLIIGRPREYLNEKYVVSEILKKIENPLWVEVRKMELREGKDYTKYGEAETKEETNEEAIEEEGINARIFKLIKEIDNGEGADTQDVITKLNVEKAEEIITKLLEYGEVFEIKPGKLKVLE